MPIPEVGFRICNTCLIATVNKVAEAKCKKCGRPMTLIGKDFDQWWDEVTALSSLSIRERVVAFLRL